MAREKPNYRDVLSYLCNEKQLPMMLTRQQVCEAISLSAPKLREEIRKGHIKVIGGKIPVGSVASFLCG